MNMRDLFRKSVFTVASVATSAVALAEGDGGATSITAELVTSYIEDGKGEIFAVLTAGAAIVGAFFIWGLIKKALNRSK